MNKVSNILAFSYSNAQSYVQKQWHMSKSLHCNIVRNIEGYTTLNNNRLWWQKDLNLEHKESNKCPRPLQNDNDEKNDNIKHSEQINQGGELERKKHFSNEGELMQPPLK